MRNIILTMSLAISASISSMPLSAATIGGITGINAFVDTLSGATCTSGLACDLSNLSSETNFLNYNSVTADDTISVDQLRADVTDTDESTYVLSLDPIAYVDLAFNTTNIYNGAGDDLVLFFVGTDFSFSFDLDVVGDNSGAMSYSTSITPVTTIITDAFGEHTLTAASINLDDFGFASDVALTDFRILLGTDDSINMPAFSLAGGFHTSPTAVVPLPLPMLLFASGLGLLGWAGRRKQR